MSEVFEQQELQEQETPGIAKDKVEMKSENDTRNDVILELYGCGEFGDTSKNLKKLKKLEAKGS